MFKKVRIQLGEGYLDRYTILEIKSLFSIYIHVFNTIKQDRFHTHAFNGLAFVLNGSYEEEYKTKKGVKSRHIGVGCRFIPKNYNHKILKSEKNTISILFAGPWSKYWTEENDNFVRTLTWGRKEVHRFTKS